MDGENGNGNGNRDPENIPDQLQKISTATENGDLDVSWKSPEERANKPKERPSWFLLMLVAAVFFFVGVHANEGSMRPVLRATTTTSSVVLVPHDTPPPQKAHRDSTNTANLTKGISKMFSANEVANMQIIVVAAEVKIVSHQNAEEISLVWQDKSATYTPQLELIGDTLYIQTVDKNELDWFRSHNNKLDEHATITIAIPNNMDNLLIDAYSVSGDMTAKNINADALHFNAVSGDFDLNHSQFNTLNLSTVSGDLELKNVEADDMIASTVSGDFEVAHFSFEDININSVSGDLELQKGTANHITANNVSGDLAVRDSVFENIDIASVSGNASIQANHGFTITSTQLSDRGKVTTEQIGDGSASISFRSISGKISARETRSAS